MCPLIVKDTYKRLGPFEIPNIHEFDIPAPI